MSVPMPPGGPQGGGGAADFIEMLLSMMGGAGGGGMPPTGGALPREPGGALPRDGASGPPGGGSFEEMLMSMMGGGAGGQLDPETLMMLEALLTQTGSGGPQRSTRATSPMPGDLGAVARQMASAPPSPSSIPRGMRNY